MRAFLITFVLLLALIVGADFVGRAVAESKAGEAIAQQTGGQVAPEVDIHGFSFLAQALPGDYQKVTIAQQDLAVGPFTGVGAVVELYDVTYPLSAAFSGSTDEMVARRADLRATIPAAALSAHLQQTGLTLSAGDGGAARLSTTVDVLGRQVPVSADIQLTLADGTLTLTPGQVTADGVDLPDPAALAQALTLSVPLTGLPINLDAASVGVVDDAVVVTATVLDLRVSDLR